MSSHGASQMPPSEPIDREWRRLLLQLNANQGRWGLVLLVYRISTYQDAMADALDRHWPGTRRVTATSSRHPEWMPLEDTLAATAATGARAIQLMGFDRWLSEADDEGSRRIGHMNFRREGFADRVTVPVLLWLRPETLARLSHHAVDLWSWRAGIFEIVDGVSALNPART